ncbi:MAG: DUF1778 domain-containing protein [Oceanicaulis sp.]
MNLTADEFALGRIDRAAARRGVTRSAFMVGAALELAETTFETEERGSGADHAAG